jgi:hypothetical protein
MQGTTNRRKVVMIGLVATIASPARMASWSLKKSRAKVMSRSNFIVIFDDLRMVIPGP